MSITIIDAVILCPRCSFVHIDEGEWSDRPHRTHLCLFCRAEFDVTVRGTSIWTNIQTHGLPKTTRRYWITTDEGDVVDAFFFSRMNPPHFRCDGVQITALAWAEYSTPAPYAAKETANV